jgi:hypothetical protein
VRLTLLKVTVDAVSTELEFGVPGFNFTAVTGDCINTKNISAINEIVILKATIFFFNSLNTIYSPS